MKLSFSTNGWRGMSFAEFSALAAELGFNGIELHDNPDFPIQDSPLEPERTTAAARKLGEQGLSVSCIDSLCDIADPASAEKSLEEIENIIDRASRLGCPYVRIHAGSGTGSTAEDNAAAVSVIGRVISSAEKNGITLLIETTGIFADTERLRDILNIFASDNLAALWDFNHPYRFNGEEPEKTIENLGAYVKHVHIKDSKLVNGKVRYCILGDGDLPVRDMFNALNSVGYGGFISLECNPAMMDDFNDINIVLPHFVNYISRFDSEEEDYGLYRTRDKTGRYVWKKDELINMTFSRVLDTMVEHFPDQYAFKYTTLDYTRTYTEFRRDVDTFARSLIAMGVKAGDKVAVWATNVPAWYIAFWATTKIGAVLVTVNTAYKIHEAEYLLRQSDTHTLVMIKGSLDADYSKIIAELCPELEVTPSGKPLHSRRLPFLRNVITVGYSQKGCLTWEEAMDISVRVPIEEVYRRASLVKPSDVANMQYTSGTTGFPKGVMLTHYSIINNGKCIGDRMELSTADRMMVQVPMFHCFGMVLTMTSIMTHGGTLCPLPYFSAKSSLACINLEKITCFNGVPTNFIGMLQHPDFASTDFSHMRTGIMAGANCPTSLMEEAAQKMNMTIVSVYGQTEASPGCTMSSSDDTADVRYNTVGHAFPHVECKIIDPETGEELPDNMNGEFVARGYNVMKGYYKMPKATAGAIDSEGWLHSGDIACRRPDGNYLITGRLKDMIIRGGENIYPREIEEFIFTHPLVEDVQVVGVPDRKYGEEALACIILKPGAEISEEEMRDFMVSHIARHKVPKYIDFVDGFPKNAAGKILKYKMREEAVVRHHLENESK